MRFAHISDLHFAKATWNPLQFFSKRWLGNANLFFSRRHDYDTERLTPLPDLLEQLRVDHAIICGDISTTGRRQEFAMAAELAKKFASKGVKTTVVPGNHDHYTKRGYKKKWFYDFFPEEKLKTKTVSSKSLGKGWWIIALDTAAATSWTSSRGIFGPETQFELETALAEIPENNKVILVNHFPFFQHDSPRKILERGQVLQSVLHKHPKVKLYLHGHTHRHCIADLRADGLPIILDSGSAPHRMRGTWNLINIGQEKCTIDVFSWKDEWKSDRKVELLW